MMDLVDETRTEWLCSAANGERLRNIMASSSPKTLPVRDLVFFYLPGHGVEPALINDVLGLARRFFALPERDKLAIEMVNSPHFRGYNRAGFEHTRGKPDWREQVDIGPERPALTFDREAPPWDRLQGPN